MQCLELVRRANVMSRDNYHNVFGGYMEELYAVHDQFWNWTLWPCLEQVSDTSPQKKICIIFYVFHVKIYWLWGKNKITLNKFLVT